jgi:hypothetical protein
VCGGRLICWTRQEKGRRSLDPHVGWGGERSCRLYLVRDQTPPPESRRRRRGSSGSGTACGRRAPESVLGGRIRLGGRGHVQLLGVAVAAGVWGGGGDGRGLVAAAAAAGECCRRRCCCCAGEVRSMVKRLLSNGRCPNRKGEEKTSAREL